MSELRGDRLTTSDSLGRDLQIAYGRRLERERRRWQTSRTIVLVSLGTLIVTGAGLGAAAMLGRPAPAHVQKELAGGDQGLPADLRLNPDVRNARAVASTDTATLYAASLRGGGHCTELVTSGERGRGATCTTAAELATRPLDVVLPFDDGAGPDSPVVMGGRVNAQAGESLEAVYADGASDTIQLGVDRFFVFDVPAAHRASVHAAGADLVARDTRGSVVARTSIPADWDDPATPDENVPLYVSTRSDESDFTKVYGLEGHVSAAGAARLELDYGDGSRAVIPLRPDGSYEYTVPPSRVDDFMQPRTVVARDRAGHSVASADVAAVAYWRRFER